MTGIKYYHGGAPGLRQVLPPAATGAPTTADYGAEGICRRDKVYVVTSYHAASLYAAMHPSGRGVIYEVQPIGVLEDDPDFDNTNAIGVRSYQCDGARVLKKHRMKHKDRKAIIRLTVGGRAV